MSGFCSVPEGTMVTSVRSQEYAYTWVINDFSAWLAKVDGEQQSFAFPDNSRIKWVILLHPTSALRENSCGLFIKSISSVATLGNFEADIQLSLEDSKGQVIEQKTAKEGERTAYGPINGSADPDWTSGKGWNNFICKETLLEKLKPEDKLIIKCKITAPAEIVNESFEKDAHKLPEPFSSSLAKDLKALHDGSYQGDVTISAGGQLFHAHKCILVARSPVFAAMFGHQMQEKIRNSISISDVDPKVFAELLRYIYSDEFTSVGTMASALYTAADKYAVRTLQSRCRHHILEKLDWETAADTLMLADLHSDQEMKKRTFEFLSGSVAAKITKTLGWKKLVRTHPHLVDEAIIALASGKAASNGN